MINVDLDTLKQYILIKVKVTFLKDYKEWKQGQKFCWYLSLVDEDENVLSFTDDQELAIEEYDISYSIQFYEDSIKERMELDTLDPDEIK